MANPVADPEIKTKGSTANPEEIARFTAMADAWWDTGGKFRPLHRLNPVRDRKSVV